MALPVSSSVIKIANTEFQPKGVGLDLGGIVPSTTFTGSFYEGINNIEFYIYDSSLDIVYSDLNFQNYTVENETVPQSGSLQDNLPPSGSEDVSVNELNVDPETDIFNLGYSTGTFYALYNFINVELLSQNQYFISEISPSRTEIKIQNNYLNNEEIISSYNEFYERLISGEHFDEFYINFGGNTLFIATNIDLEIDDEGKPSILIKLYDPLSNIYGDLSLLSIITKVAETQVYKVDYIENLEPTILKNYIKGPNLNIPLKSRSNNSTGYKNLNDLINTDSSASYNQFLNLSNQRGVHLRVDYSNWENFVHYSSAEKRLSNFKEKITNIENYQAEISQSHIITGATTGSSVFSSSIATKQSKINDIIQKFDGYEYYLYFMTGSTSWPKSSTSYPYKLYSVSSSQALNWYGSIDESNAYFSNTGLIYSASLYDQDNQDNLYYIIPPFISNNTDNEPYINFVHMTGQSFDDIWLYTKAVSEIRNNRSQLTGSTIPLDLADEVIESFGFETYGNDFNSQLFNSSNVGIFPTSASGEEYIKYYVDIASGSIINYYDKTQTTLGYVVQLIDPGNLYPLENNAQEIYKRIFHNMVSLVKRKGTVEGLRQLINIWGVPNTMLHISEFGGKDRSPNTYDLSQNVYNKAFTTYQAFTGSNVNTSKEPMKWNANTCVVAPWNPLSSNMFRDREVALPDCIQFRFKPAKNIDGLPYNTQYGWQSHFSESLLIKRHSTNANVYHNSNFAIQLHYSQSNSSSFSGSRQDPYHTYASMSFIFSGSRAEGGEGADADEGYFKSDPIHLPFYNGGWWSVQMQRLTHHSASVNDQLNTYELRVAQKSDNESDSSILYEGVTTMSMGSNVTESLNKVWNDYTTPAANYLYATSITKQSIYLGGTPLNWGGTTAMPGEQLGINTNYNRIGNAASTANGTQLGGPFSGSFQEFRYYARALSQSVFNKFVMNPHFIGGFEGKISGAFSGFDILNYRLPLGSLNEIENTGQYARNHVQSALGYSTVRQGGNRVALNPAAGYGLAGDAVGSHAFGSVHPASGDYNTAGIVSGTGVYKEPLRKSFYTGSFFLPHSQGLKDSDGTPGNMCDFMTTVYFTYGVPTASANFSNPSGAFSASRYAPNNEIYFYDQPAVGSRNRISNKIQLASSDEAYGYVLSPFKSIIQDKPQSQSYSENINNLEVGFSFQNEINNDIISTYDGNIINDIIADPLNYFKTPDNDLADFNSWAKSTDRYPGLTALANNYFRKYTGPRSGSADGRAIYGAPKGTSYKLGEQRPGSFEKPWDYNRLIKFYETSLFKAIKNYVPARTSISTGIIVKQHLLERNRIKPIGIKANYPLAKTPETGSIDGTPYYKPNRRRRGYGFNSIIWKKNLEITGSIQSGSISGSTGGSVNKYNFSGSSQTLSSNEFMHSGVNKKYFTSQKLSQSNKVDTQGGLQFISSSNIQKEFYDGEYSGSKMKYNPTYFIDGNRYNPYRTLFYPADDEPYIDCTKGFLLNTDETQTTVSDFFVVENKNKVRIETSYTVQAGTAYARLNGIFQNLKPNRKYRYKYTISGFAGGGNTWIGEATFNAGTANLNDFHINSGNGTTEAYFTASFAESGRAAMIWSAPRFRQGNVLSEENIVISGGPVFLSSAAGQKCTWTFHGIEEVTGVDLSVLNQGNGLISVAFNGGNTNNLNHLQPYDGFKLPISQSIYFENSDYNPINNNVSESRPNTHYMDVDYSTNQYVPVNSTVISEKKAKKAQVPDSYYTDTERLNSRYRGTKLSAKNYNKYTSQYTATASFINGDTGSWSGDTSYGVSPVVEYNPIYIAHFATSKESKEYFSTVTFYLDQLIQIPSYPLSTTLKDGTIETVEYDPVTINLEGIKQGVVGNSGRLVDVATTFNSKGFKASVEFENPTKDFKFTGRDSTEVYLLDYSNISQGEKDIIASAAEFQSYYTNQKTKNELTYTQSVRVPDWYGGFIGK